jgi:hypothetical protein
MLNSDGDWFTVNTANNATRSTEVLCMRHANFVVQNLTGNPDINRFFRYYPNARVNYQTARASCQAEDGDLTRMYGSAGRAAMYFMITQKGMSAGFWLGISNIENNMTQHLWTTVDGEIELLMS